MFIKKKACSPKKTTLVKLFCKVYYKGERRTGIREELGNMFFEPYNSHFFWNLIKLIFGIK